jgi:predicted MFS family arabinose efflux permease
MTRADTLTLLRRPEFRLLWLGQTASSVGDALVILALPFAVLELTGSASDLGLVLTAYTVPLALFALVGGVWADRLPRRRVMLVADAVRACVQGAIALLLLSGIASLWQLIPLTAVYAAATAFFQPAVTGAVPETVAERDLQPANALLGVSRELAFVAGQPLAGLIVAIASPGAAFAVDAASFVVSALALASLRISIGPAPPRLGFLVELRAGLSAIAARTWLWVVMTWSWSHLFLVVAPLYVLGPVVAKQSLGGAAAWGLVTGAFSAGAIAGGAVAFRWRPTRPLLAAALFEVLAATGPALLAAGAPAALVAIAQFASGAASGFFTAVYLTALQERVPAELRARVSSVHWLGSTVSVSLGYALAGPAAAVAGFTTVFAASAVWVAVSTGVILLVPTVRELRAIAPPAKVSAT